MVNLDPRAKEKITTEAVSGVITDRAIQLLNMLNNAIGAEGQIGTVASQIVFNDGTGDRTETLSNRLISPSADQAKWKEDERIYFQATNKRIDTIADELQEGLNGIKNDLVSNITNLFNLLEEKEGTIDALEQAVMNAQTIEELFAAQQALEAETQRILTSDEALEAMVNIFFESFNLSIEKINSEIFDKLHDFDDDYSNDSTNIENEKFFYQRTYALPGDVAGKARSALIINNVDELFERILEDQRILHEDTNGAGTYNQALEDFFVTTTVQIKFTQGNLKLSDDIIARIILDKNISIEDQANITNMQQFIELIDKDFDQLIEYTGISDRQAAINSLFKDDLKITTPKYYKDERTIYDILNGKNNDPNNGNTKDMIFSSVNSQMKNVAQSVEDLMSKGFGKVSGSNLQSAIRANPFAAIEYLEKQKTNQTGILLELVNEQIDILTGRQVLDISNHIEELVQEGRALQGANNQARIDEINVLIGKLTEIKDQIRLYDASQNTDTKARLAEIYPEMANFSFSDTLEFNTFTNALDLETKFSKAPKTLYVMENTESGQKNTEYYTRKLPEIKADGSIPEETMPIPPLLSPTPLSAVVARIGDELIKKSKALVNGDDIPTTQWMESNTSTLLTINNNLASLGRNSAGEAFLNNLRANFKGVIKDFFNANIGLKNTQDDIKSELESTIERQQELTALNGSGFDLASQTLGTNLISIENALTGNVKSGVNFINRAGLEQTQVYLNQNIDALDDVNYEQEIDNRLDEIGLINDKIRDGSATQEDYDRLAIVQNQITGLRRDENNLEKAQELLYGTGSRTNPQAGSILDLVNNFNNSINNLIRNNGGLGQGQSKSDFLNKLEDDKTTEFKDAVKAYSDSLTNFEVDKNADGQSDIIDTFKASLDQTSLDLDANGENDFVDIQNMIDKLGLLSENIVNTFGGIDPNTGGIDQQGIRRLILLMFVFSMLEAGDWQARKDDSEVERYAIS
jgi:hypothetical protein